jgi:hypothetical protein
MFSKANKEPVRPNPVGFHQKSTKLGFITASRKAFQ